MQLEGLEHMYGEVLRMLGTSRIPGRMHEQPTLRTAGFRRRHGSVSSLPSSSVSGRPIRDRKRTDDRRKVRDMKVDQMLIYDCNSALNHELLFFFLIVGYKQTLPKT